MTIAVDDLQLTAHLMRRAGFGASRDELEALADRGYEAVVEHLLKATETTSISDDLIRRYHNEQSGLMGQYSAPTYWLYKMISSDAPLSEKIALFWHSIFATGYTGKVVQGKTLVEQIAMFRRHGLGRLNTLLLELSENPAMIAWLDNVDNHKGAINENYGRELLELFSMGVGNYTEDDVKECSRAFTGWTIANTEYMVLRAQRDSIWPYGRLGWQFEYRPEDHDNGEKEFLGRKGNLSGKDVIEVICSQPATANFISRHIYHFFVADEPPVPQWPYTPPADPEAIELLSKTYFESGYDITEMLRTLFNSDFFKSRQSWYSKLKSPAELVAGVLRLSGEFHRPTPKILERAMQMLYMGQHLTNPPSVEGWHQGLEWIDTGTLMERLNFVSDQFGDTSKPSVGSMIDNIVGGLHGKGAPAEMVDRCLDQLGVISVSEDTRSTLDDFAAGIQPANGDAAHEQARRDAARLLQLVASSPEFQRT